MVIFRQNILFLFANGFNTFQFFPGLRSIVPHLFTYMGATALQRLRLLGNTRDLAMPIVTTSSTRGEYLLSDTHDRGAGNKQVTPHSRGRSVGLPPRLIKAVTVLDSHDGPSGAKITHDRYSSGKGEVYVE